MMKIIFYIYLILCIGAGIWLGLLEWGGITGALGGGFIGLLISLAIFASFTIISIFIPHKKT